MPHYEDANHRTQIFIRAGLFAAGLAGLGGVATYWAFTHYAPSTSNLDVLKQEWEAAQLHPVSTDHIDDTISDIDAFLSSMYDLIWMLNQALPGKANDDPRNYNYHFHQVGRQDLIHYFQQYEDSLHDLETAHPGLIDLIQTDGKFEGPIRDQYMTSMAYLRALQHAFRVKYLSMPAHLHSTTMDSFLHKVL